MMNDTVQVILENEWILKLVGALLICGVYGLILMLFAFILWLLLPNRPCMQCRAMTDRECSQCRTPFCSAACMQMTHGVAADGAVCHVLSLWQYEKRHEAFVQSLIESD